MWYLLLALSQAASPPSAAPAAAPRSARDVSIGWIEMDAHRGITVRYDRDPAHPRTTYPEDAEYSDFAALAGDMKPGEKKPLRPFVGTYTMTPDGTYVIQGWARDGRATSPSSGFAIDRTEASYRCYGRVLEKPAPGYHFLTAADAAKIERCASAG